MNFRVRSFIVLVCLAFCASVLSADNIFILPDGSAGNEIQIFSGDPPAPGATYNGAFGAVANIDASPSGSRYYTVSRDPVDALITTDQNFTVVERSGDWGSPATGGEVTPDGKYLLVLSGAMRIYNAGDGTLIDNLSLPGSNPNDLAVSIDSRYAFVASQQSTTLDRVDLTTLGSGSVDIQSLAISPSTTAVSVGPTGRVYVSSRNLVRVIDGETLTETAAISVNGEPQELSFTPDGNYGVTVNGAAGSGVSGWVFDLTTNTADDIKGLFGPAKIVMDPRVQIVSNDRCFMTSPQAQVIYEVQIPGSDISVYDPDNVADEVNGIVKSGEYPEANYLYYVNRRSFFRVDLASNRVGPSQPTFNTPEGLLLAGPASTGQPTDALLYNNNQQVPEEGEFEPIVARALDATGLPVFGATVEFASVPGVTFTDAMALTNRDGLAMAYVNPGDVLGAIPVDVTLGGALMIRFDLAVGDAPGGGSTAITILDGQGQLLGDAFGGFFGPDPLTIRLNNIDGSPAASEIVQWALVTPGTGILDFNETTTDADGVTFNEFAIRGLLEPSLSYEQSIIRAVWGESSADFYVTAFPESAPGGGLATPPQVDIRKPAQSERDLVGRSGETLVEAIEVWVAAASGSEAGRPIPNVGLKATTGNTPESGPWAMCVGGTALTAADNGLATCDLRVGGQLGTDTLDVTVGGPYQRFLGFSITVLAGMPATISPIQGDGQSGLPGETLATKLVAEVRDASGNMLTGQAVTWEVVEAGRATLSDVLNTTDVSGRVSATATLGTTPGIVNVRVTAGGTSGSFALTVLSTATQMRKVLGDSQSAVINTQFPQPLVVQVLDEDSVGVEGMAVSFDVTSGPATVSAPSATTNAQGFAEMMVSAGSDPGNVTVSAAFSGLPAVVFNLSVRLPGPALTPGSFVNAASGFPGVTPGGITSIYAAGVAPGLNGCAVAESPGALPLQLAGVTVQFGPDALPRWAPIFSVCNINGMESVTVQAPFELSTGNTGAKVTVFGGATTVENVPVYVVLPGQFETTGIDGLRYGVVMRPNGSFVSPLNPAQRGEILCVFGTGVGQVAPPAETNSAGIPGQQVLSDVVVGVNHMGVRVVGAEYAINMIGVYAVYFEMPLDAETGPARPLAFGVRPPDGGGIIWGNGSTIAVQ